MHIAPTGNITARMLKEDQPAPLKFIAKDGADLPKIQQVDVNVSSRFGVGETADFAFTPSEPCEYELYIGYPNPKRRWKQKNGRYHHINKASNLDNL